MTVRVDVTVTSSLWQAASSMTEQSTLSRWNFIFIYFPIKGLHGESVESAINDGYSSRNKLSSI